MDSDKIRCKKMVLMVFGNIYYRCWLIITSVQQLYAVGENQL